MYDIIVLSKRLQERCCNQRETKMGGFQTGRVSTTNGAAYLSIIENCSYIWYVEGHWDLPFGPDDIVDISVTHEMITISSYHARSQYLRDQYPVEFNNMYEAEGLAKSVLKRT